MARAANHPAPEPSPMGACSYRGTAAVVILGGSRRQDDASRAVEYFTQRAIAARQRPHDSTPGLPGGVWLPVSTNCERRWKTSRCSLHRRRRPHWRARALRYGAPGTAAGKKQRAGTAAPGARAFGPPMTRDARRLRESPGGMDAGAPGIPLNGAATSQHAGGTRRKPLLRQRQHGATAQFETPCRPPPSFGEHGGPGGTQPGGSTSPAYTASAYVRERPATGHRRSPACASGRTSARPPSGARRTCPVVPGPVRSRRDAPPPGLSELRTESATGSGGSHRSTVTKQRPGLMPMPLDQGDDR